MGGHSALPGAIVRQVPHAGQAPQARPPHLPAQLPGPGPGRRCGVVVVVLAPEVEPACWASGLVPMRYTAWPALMVAVVVLLAGASGLITRDGWSGRPA